MSQRYEQELLTRVNEVLHYIWDPIGVRGEPNARDEYDSYVPEVYSLFTTVLVLNRSLRISIRSRQRGWDSALT
jgi:hypothetical protein